MRHLHEEGCSTLAEVLEHGEIHEESRADAMEEHKWKRF